MILGNVAPNTPGDLAVRGTTLNHSLKVNRNRRATEAGRENRLNAALILVFCVLWD